MALEACFQLFVASPAAFPAAARTCPKEKNTNLLTSGDPKRALASSFSSSSSSFYSMRGAKRRAPLICQAKNALNEVLEVTDENWGELILDSKIPVVVEFWAPSCGPCKMVAPVMDELARDYAGKVACFKINTDDSLKMASRYGIGSIPTVLIIKDGEKLESVTGAVKKSTLSSVIDKYLDV